MLTAIVLFCALSLTSDLHECDQNSARDVLRVPMEFASPATCFLEGQAYLAGTELGRSLADDERVKITCTPTTRTPQRARILVGKTPRFESGEAEGKSEGMGRDGVGED